MSIEFKCPHCQTPLVAKDDQAGTRGKCPNCQKVITVPSAKPEDKETQQGEGERSS